MGISRRLGSALLLVVIVAATPAAARPSGSEGQVVARPFVVPATSERLYGVAAPSENPALQITRLVTDDGTELHLETWLPDPRDGRVPPPRVPTVLLATPYHAVGQAPAANELLEALVERGYAYSRMHLRGTGASTGCMGLLDRRDAEDVSVAIEYLAERAPWSNGRVGLSGLSLQGAAGLNAVLRGDTDRTDSVRAVEVAAPALSAYATVAAHDGVPQLVTGQGFAPNLTAVSVLNAISGGSADPVLAERVGCLPHHAEASIGLLEGNVSEWFRERDLRPAVEALDVPLLVFHGYEDYDPLGVLPIAQSGFFDRLPDGVPHVGIFGMWQHEYPLENGGPYSDLRLDVRRADSERMRVAWFDHFLRDIDADVEQWPRVQVQTTDGLWRVLDRWPTPDGVPGELALGPSGVLGATAPSGTTTYREGPAELKASSVPGTGAVFVTGPLRGRLELSGIAEAALWVELEEPDAHVVVTLEALDSDGNRIPGARTYGSRSAQHLEPLVDGRFVQSRPRLAPVGTPVQIVVRLNPIDLAVPPGGRLRMTVTGSANTTEGVASFRRSTPGLAIPDPVIGQGTQPSGVVQTVTILHDCDHPSTLRFTMPGTRDFLTVPQLDPRDPTSTVAPVATRMPVPDVDGGGAATRAAC